MPGVHCLFSLRNAHIKQNCNYSEVLGLQVYNLRVTLPFIDSRDGLLVKLGGLDAKWS